jgi:hypothetical protein
MDLYRRQRRTARGVERDELLWIMPPAPPPTKPPARTVEPREEFRDGVL